jgi:hypothetical protein
VGDEAYPHDDSIGVGNVSPRVTPGQGKGEGRTGSVGGGVASRV